jgi:hypothetical protein
MKKNLVSLATVVLLLTIIGYYHRNSETTITFAGEYFEEYPEEGMSHGAYAPFKVIGIDFSKEGCQIVGTENVTVSCGQYGCSQMRAEIKIFSSLNEMCHSVSVSDTVYIDSEIPRIIEGVKVVKTSEPLIPFDGRRGGYHKSFNFSREELGL